MGQIGVAITNLPTVIFLKKPFSDGLGGGYTHCKLLIISKQKGKNRQKCTPLFKFSHEKIEGSVMPVKKQQKELPQYENAPK